MCPGAVAQPSQFDVTAVTGTRDICHMQGTPNPITLFLPQGKPYLVSNMFRWFHNALAFPIDIEDAAAASPRG